jgi:coiled-coil domain-containing protein 102A
MIFEQPGIVMFFRELLELRHGHGRLRKAHSERGEELTHWRRKSETSEKEVKRLRTRIEELKKEMARAEDEMDESANSIRCTL